MIMKLKEGARAHEGCRASEKKVKYGAGRMKFYMKIGYKSAYKFSTKCFKNYYKYSMV
jgi:hypothetical protein